MLVGIDEVGRGCWAGPVVAGAVILRRTIPGLKDSKQLTKLQREQLSERIYTEALACGLGWVPPEELDSVGMTAAITLAMERALADLEIDNYTEVIIDGSYNFLRTNPLVRCLTKADTFMPAVSAASIIAKVARDRFMAEQAATFPEYGFEQHVGYGTAAHQAAIKLYGLTALHRRSFKPIRLIAA